MRRFFITFVIFCCFWSCQKAEKNDGFSFVFITDVHLMPERNANEGFLQAIDTINRLAPDFVISGGDQIMDGLKPEYTRVDSLFNLWDESAKRFNMPVYTTMGNHDIFGLYRNDIDSLNENYGKKMYENRLAKRYYSFNHKHWHFIILDGNGIENDHSYYGYLDSVQVAWLMQDLEATGKNVPIVVCTHIPMLSVALEITGGPTTGLHKSSIINNSNEVRKILEQYNVKMVLQGHLHFLEDIYYNGIHYITGGAVCANWWRGARYGMEEGFVRIDVSGEDFSWEYVDYGWEVKK
ncbi:MAG: metallophosphoesterase [Dysgonamonadaceae bacterium]|jgi:3',5'-cyclic AMP phosphodiesterase CpdA|nr:metallophosphoesterase [Dysgonamonadaceae bacterium]